jgi:cytoskeletal protein CcmA (bactofilin family)
MSRLLENYYNNKKIKTVLGKKTYFNGDLVFQDSLKINGNFTGKINATGFLVVGEDSVIEADISAHSVVVCGTVKGNIYASEKVEMQSTGKIYGNVKAKKIKISDGVIFSGKCEIMK